VVHDVKTICAKRIYTANIENDIVQCLAYSPSQKVFTAVGSRQDILRLYPNSVVSDLGDKVVLPGLYDSHGHMMQYGVMQENVNLFGATSYEG
jgi:predicted amidohydrolase YtcJ